MRDLGRELDDAGGTPVNGVTHDAQPHTSSTTLVRRLALSAITAGLMAAGGMVLPWHTAAAETHTNCIQFDPSGSVTLTPDCSETIHGVLGPPQPPLEVINPCNGDTGALSLDIAQAVYHITVNGAGDAWDTGTTIGTAVFTDDAGPSGSGHFTNWFGDEFNAQNMVQPSTFSVVIHLSTGQTATFHMASNTVFTPNGAEITVNQQNAGCS